MTRDTTQKLDPVTFEVVTNALDTIADQAAIALFRSAYSSIVRESLDYSTAVFDHEGHMLAQGLTTAMHLGSFPDAMEALLGRFGDSITPGDVYIMNDPYGSGGMHLPDMYIVKPVFFADSHVGFVTTLTHLADVGGLTPGSNSVHSTEIYQEGLRIPWLKLIDAGVPTESIFAILAKNTRLPVKLLGDIRAQIAGCNVADESFTALFARYGIDTLRFYFSELRDYAERVMRGVISEIPDGSYEFTDYIDGLGEEPEEIRFQVRVTIDGDEMFVDWAGTSGQVKAGINAPFAYTKAATFLAARLLVTHDIPNCDGYMRPLHTSAPPGTIVNPLEPAACATRGMTGCRALEAILGALAQAIPDRIPAAPGGDNYWPSIGGYHDGAPFVYVESIMGTWGGRPTHDGTEGVPHPAGNQPNQPIEVVEARNPLQVMQYCLLPDTGGPGKYRGGLSLVREFRILADDAVLTIRTDRRSHLPYGLSGGESGTPAWNIMNPGPNQRILPTLPMEAVQLDQGDVLKIVLAGGGGWGNPTERDPALALHDILEEKITIGYAERHYGIVVDPQTLTVDLEATARARQAMQREAAGRER